MAETEIPNYIPGISVEDVEPGVYEGGYKTWECAEDLANYLLHHETQFEALGKSMTVIEVSSVYVVKISRPSQLGIAGYVCG